jgi:hypothetical protein
MNSDNDNAVPAKLIERIEKIMREHDTNEQKPRRALSLAAEAARTPAGERRTELVRKPARCCVEPSAANPGQEEAPVWSGPFVGSTVSQTKKAPSRTLGALFYFYATTLTRVDLIRSVPPFPQKGTRSRSQRLSPPAPARSGPHFRVLPARAFTERKGLFRVGIPANN